MNLWIRSQDKTTLIRSYEIYISEYGKGSYVIRAKKTSHILGAYKTMERALKVLDEIQEAKLGNFHYRCNNNVKVSSKEDTIVYEMPKD